MAAHRSRPRTSLEGLLQDDEPDGATAMSIVDRSANIHLRSSGLRGLVDEDDDAVANRLRAD